VVSCRECFRLGCPKPSEQEFWYPSCCFLSGVGDKRTCLANASDVKKHIGLLCGDVRQDRWALTVTGSRFGRLMPHPRLARVSDREPAILRVPLPPLLPRQEQADIGPATSR